MKYFDLFHGLHYSTLLLLYIMHFVILFIYVYFLYFMKGKVLHVHM